MQEKCEKMPNIAKISVEKHNSNEQFLYDMDKNLPLSDIIGDICKKSGLPVSSVYGLKLKRTKEIAYVNNYLSEETYKNIQHSDCLKIAFSLEYLLKNRILPHLNDPEGAHERTICFEDLKQLALDPVFISELAKDDSHFKIIDAFTSSCGLTDSEILALLMTICHLFQKNYIVDTSLDILSKTVDILKNAGNNTEHIKYCLSTFYKILIHKDEVFIPWKQQIIKMVPIKDLMRFIYSEQYGQDVHYSVLLLINTIIRLCKGDQKMPFIKEMNLKQNRDNIYKHIICRNNLDRNTEHELYVLQTYILSLYKEALNSEININDNNIVTREEFELCEDDVKRSTILIDFEETELLSQGNRTNSIDNLLDEPSTERLSAASLISQTSECSTTTSRQTSINLDVENLTINYLTLEALKHFKKFHYKIFYQSQIEEKVYEPGIFVTSERVVKMLGKILHIGKDPPDSRSVFYQPIVFNCSSRLPFLLELFSRTMWLLSRTRREMKVSTIEDYPKVMNVLQKQVKLILEKRPKNFKNLTDLMTETTFDVVLQQWENEKNEQMQQILQSHPCILELKTFYIEENKKYLRENRLNVLKIGDDFPKINEKKIVGTIFVQLHKNEKELIIYDYDTKTKKKKGQFEGIPIKEVTHVAVGQNCKHYNLCKNPSLIFSVIYGPESGQINFIAKNEKTASYWIDGLSILKDFHKKSDYYQKELDGLVEMDIRLKIIELQNINIPKNPPPIPPLPADVKPPLPPKPDGVTKKYKRKY